MKNKTISSLTVFSLIVFLCLTPMLVHAQKVTKLINTGKDEKAIEYFNKQEGESRNACAIEMGDAYFAKSNYSTAAAYYEKTDKPESYLLKIADTYFEKGELDSAAKYYEKTGNKESNFLKVANKYFEKGELSKAALYYEKTGNQESNFLKVADAFFEKEDLPNAAKYYEKTTTQENNFLKVADAFFEKGDYYRASEYYKNTKSPKCLVVTNSFLDQEVTAIELNKQRNQYLITSRKNTSDSKYLEKFTYYIHIKGESFGPSKSEPKHINFSDDGTKITFTISEQNNTLQVYDVNFNDGKVNKYGPFKSVSHARYLDNGKLFYSGWSNEEQGFYLDMDKVASEKEKGDYSDIQISHDLQTVFYNLKSYLKYKDNYRTSFIICGDKRYGPFSVTGNIVLDKKSNDWAFKGSDTTYKKFIYKNDVKSGPYKEAIVQSNTETGGISISYTEEVGDNYQVTINGQQIDIPFRHASSLCVSPNGKHYAFAATRNEQSIIYGSDGEIELPKQPGSVKMSNDGKRIAYVLREGKEDYLYINENKITVRYIFANYFISPDIKNVIVPFYVDKSFMLMIANIPDEGEPEWKSLPLTLQVKQAPKYVNFLPNTNNIIYFAPIHDYKNPHVLNWYIMFNEHYLDRVAHRSHISIDGLSVSKNGGAVLIEDEVNKLRILDKKHLVIKDRAGNNKLSFPGGADNRGFYYLHNSIMMIVDE